MHLLEQYCAKPAKSERDITATTLQVVPVLQTLHKVCTVAYRLRSTGSKIDSAEPTVMQDMFINGTSVSRVSSKTAELCGKTAEIRKMVVSFKLNILATWRKTAQHTHSNTMLLGGTWNDVIIQNTKTSAAPHSGAWLRHVVLA